MKLAVAPETVQMAGVAATKLIGKPELADAASVNVVPTVWAGMAPKVMVCASPLTVRLCETGVAAA